MVFGKKQAVPINEDEQVQQEQDFEDVVHVDDEDDEEISKVGSSSSQGTHDKPLYEEVTIIGAANSKNPGGTKQWVCKHCKEKFNSSYTRMHCHFFGPLPGKKKDIARCKVMLSDREIYEQLQKRVKAAEKAGISRSLKTSVVTKKPNINSKKPIEQAFSVMERSWVDLKIIRALCANGIPFNVLRNPQFQEMISALKRAPEGYKPPSSEKARTTLLDECVRDVEKDLTPFKDTWYAQGLSIVSDGWTNIKHKPLINVLAVNNRGSMFMYAEDFSGVEKTGAAIAEFLTKAIESVGSSNVLSVVTDNAANCKAAGKEIEKAYKHIFWSPCCVHTLNLVFKDFAKEFIWLHVTYKRGKEVVKYFLNHGQALSIFRDNSQLELLKVAKTRFASHYILLKRLNTCREALSTTISLNSWREWAAKQSDDHTTDVVATIRNDDFWNDVENILKITKPIYLLVKFCDGEGAKMGEIYEKMDNMLGEIKEVMENGVYALSYPKAVDIITTRWNKMNIPLHCLGFALTPRFYDTRYLQMKAPGGLDRRAPNLDKEVMKGVMEAFQRISENKEEYQLLRTQFAKFHMKTGLFGIEAAHLDAVTMEAIEWWSTYGAEAPELADVAKKVLSQPISSSSAERNWSTYSYIHSVKRNRLNSQRADKLVYVHSNIRLCSRFSEGYKEGPHKKWDVDAESTNLESARIEDVWDELDSDDERTKKGKKQRFVLARRFWHVRRELFHDAYFDCGGFLAFVDSALAPVQSRAGFDSFFSIQTLAHDSDRGVFQFPFPFMLFCLAYIRDNKKITKNAKKDIKSLPAKKDEERKHEDKNAKMDDQKGAKKADEKATEMGKESKKEKKRQREPDEENEKELRTKGYQLITGEAIKELKDKKKAKVNEKETMQRRMTRDQKNTRVRMEKSVPLRMAAMMVDGQVSKVDSIKVWCEDDLFGYESFTYLTWTDFNKVFSMDELSGTVVTTYTMYLYEQIKNGSKGDHGICFMTPTATMQHERKAKARNVDDSSRLVAERLSKRNDNHIILLPYNPGRHWVLGVLDMKKNTCYYLDSIGPMSVDVQFKHIVDAAIGLYNVQSGSKKMIKLKWVNSKCPIQPGSTECGYYVLKFMKEIVQQGVEVLENDNIGGDTNEYTDADFDEIREEWATYVSNFIFR
ncbi:hypothetical protein SSX86_022457 [Deinandra increscens subsp. villosa]|uniref:Ubiquitin-like protease family profile domain-containing protein n=1 Tax=Deinandra increscens subsp. villosa TaxID=3103831 RepID=A0AAP0CKF4_9ASTR